MARLDNIKTVALALSIIIVLNLFVGFGIKTFYPGPEFEDFCPAEKSATRFDNKVSCEEAGGQWFDVNAGPAPRATLEGVEKPTGHCDATFECRKEHRQENDLYSRNVFIIFVIAGVIFLSLGWRVTRSAAVSSGLVFGGVLAFLVGTLRYWSGMQDYTRFILLGVILAVLIWIGYSKINKEK